MRYKLLGCKIFEREIASVIYDCRNVIDVTLVRQELHARPENLRDVLQREIDEIDANINKYSNDTLKTDFDAILLGYGLCSNVTTGLSSKKYKLVIPRAHDCLAVFMGSKDTYSEYYRNKPGTFYYTPGFVEWDCFDDEDEWKRRLQFYLERYKGNERKAQKAVAVERSMRSAYERLTYIKWDKLDFPDYERMVQGWASDKSWEYEIIQGNDSILRKLVDGEWNEEDFLIVPPGYHSEPSYEDSIITAVK
ncbi:MAG: DUF1638 domain-containing protein [Mogibacterium sp.]|nr:DUF1638 domain-containing protein [Mogibacterium sp.]